jgi:antitoxin HicB
VLVARCTNTLAVIHKDADSSYGVSFPDVPGVITAGDTLDEAIAQAAEVLAFAAEDWKELTGDPFPSPRTLDQLRNNAAFRSDSADAIVAAIPFGPGALRPAAE